MSIAGDNNPSRKNGSLSGSLSSLSSALRSASLGDGVASSNAGVLNTYRSEEERIEAALFSLGKDPAIFEEDVCVTEILQCADAPALEKITTRLRNEVQQLCTAKKTLLAENHQTFLSVGDLLEKAREGMVVTVSRMEELKTLIEEDLEIS